MNDNYDIDERMKKSNQSIGDLKIVRDAKEVDLRSKFLIYNSILINLLLWGSKRWTHTKVFSKKLEVFH